MSEFGRSEYGERLDYKHSKCQNWISAIIFYLHIAAVAIGIAYLFAVDIPKMNKQQSRQINVAFELTGVWVTIVICSLAGLTIGLIWFKAIKAYPYDIILAVFYTTIACWCCLLATGLGVLNIELVIAGAVLATATALYLYWMYDLIPFSSILLAMAANVVNVYGDVVWISIIGVVLELCWLFLWGALCGTYLYTFWYDESTDPSNGVIFLMSLSLYWGLIVFNNIVRVSACGVAATWYFSACVNHRTSPSLARTLRTSFGSICIGSLFTNVLELFRAIITAMARSCGARKTCNCFCVSITHTMDQIVRYSNTYAWAHVATYGTDFIQASKQTWKLFKNCGIQPIINEEITGTVTFCAGISAAIVNAGIGYGIAFIFYGDSQNENIRVLLPAALAIYGGISGITLTMCILTMIRGFIVTIFVCYAEDWLTMQENRPIYFNKLRKEEPRLINVTKNIAQGVPLDETEALTAQRN